MGSCASRGRDRQGLEARAHNRRRKVPATEANGPTPRVSFEQDNESEKVFRYRFRMTMKELGRGADAVVYEGMDMYSKSKVAMKLVSLHSGESEERRAELIRRHLLETQILSSISHDNIVKALDHSEKPERLIMVMEYIEGGDLLNRITELVKVKEEHARELALSLASAIDYIHRLNIVHRDIKAENILLRSANDLFDVVLTDFGLAAYCQGNNLQQRVGTMRYCAPEVLQGFKYGKAVDIWAFGVTLYLLLVGSYPFYNEDENTLMEDIILGNFSLNSTSISEGSKSLIRGLIEPRHESRFTIEEVVSHPWMRMASDKVALVFPQQNRFDFDVKIRKKIE